MATKKIKGLRVWLKENNYTYEEMQRYWDELIEINSTVRALHNSGLNWDETNLSIVAQLPTEKERTLKRLEEKHIKDEEDARNAKIESERKAYYEEHFEELMVQKIDHGKKLTEKELSNLVHEFGIETDHGENRRWTRSNYTICKLCGRYFEVDWEEGLTEYQDNEYRYQPVEVELHEYEKVITIREWKHINKEKESD